MKSIQNALFALVIAAILFIPISGFAQVYEPFDGVTKLVDWFSELNDQFDKIVKVEKRGQLLRSVDRLRKGLYALETDSQILLDSIPDERPEAEKKEQLKKLVGNLMGSVRRLSDAVRNVGADLRMYEGYEVENELIGGLRVRSQALSYLQKAIYWSDTHPWNASEIRTRLEKGLRAVKAAQIAVTSFQQKLESAK